MLHLFSSAAVLGAAATLLIAPPARAQEARLIVVEGALICAPYVPCDSGRPCVDPNDHCSSGVCKAREGEETPCCVAGTVCASTDAECVPVTLEWGHCEDEPLPPTCSDSPSEACFDRTSWEDGDCDGDTVLNRDEDDACVCENADMTTVGACMRADAGQNAQDAGPRTRPDAGNADRPAAADAWDYRGSGGCTCDATTGGGDVAWLAVGLAVALGARRRRRSRAGR